MQTSSVQLSATQLSEFHYNGFIILRGFVEEARCDAILSVAQEHLEKRIEPIETEYGYQGQSKAYRKDVSDYHSQEDAEESVRRLRQVYERDPLFKAWMEEPTMEPILRQVLDDQVVLVTAHHNSIMTKMPYKSCETKWHQDRRYWSYSDDNLVSVWLALGEEYSENGVLEFIPGSHKMVFSPEQFDEKEYFLPNHPLNTNLLVSKVSFDLEKGDVVLFHALLLHRANRNSTDSPKVSFVYTVKGSQTKAIEGTRSAKFDEVLLG